MSWPETVRLFAPGSDPRRRPVREPYLTGLTAADADALLAAHGFTCEAHLTTRELLQHYASADAGQSSVDGRAAITTAQRS